MDDTSEQENGILTALLEWSSSDVTREDAGTGAQADGNESSGSLVLNRRSYLAAAGATTATVAGCADLGRSGTVSPVSSFGYGGAPALQQTSSLSVSESEPNDTEGNADSVTIGSTVTAALTASDSDWYMVDLSAGDETVIEFSRDAASGVTAVILYDPNGEYSNLRYVSTDEPVAFGQTAETSGTHYVQVVDIQNSDGGYTLTVTNGSATETATATPTETETATATETETTTATPTATPTSEDDYGEQGYGEYGYGGIA